MTELEKLLARAHAAALANGYTRPGGINRKPRHRTPVLRKPDQPDQAQPAAAETQPDERRGESETA